MRIQGLPDAVSAEGTAPIRASVEAFSDVLGRSLASVEYLRARADAAAAALARGETDDVHGVMVAMEEASLSLQLALQVRNKLLEAYQELIRMQV